jgi:hypothetical protein
MRRTADRAEPKVCWECVYFDRDLEDLDGYSVCRMLGHNPRCTTPATGCPFFKPSPE